jgi:hypothetical protein
MVRLGSDEIHANTSCRNTHLFERDCVCVSLHRHPGYVLPDLIDPVTGLPRGRFDEGVAALQADVLAGNAALALFDVDSQDEEVQSVYKILADGLYLAFDKQGDKIYTAYP